MGKMETHSWHSDLMSVKKIKKPTVKTFKKEKLKNPVCYVCERPFRRGEPREIILDKVRHTGCKPGSFRWGMSKFGVQDGTFAKLFLVLLMLGGSFVITDNNLRRDNITVKESPWEKNTWNIRNESTFEGEGTIRKAFDGSYRVYDKNGNQKARIERR